MAAAAPAAAASLGSARGGRHSGPPAPLEIEIWFRARARGAPNPSRTPLLQHATQEALKTLAAPLCAAPWPLFALGAFCIGGPASFMRGNAGCRAAPPPQPRICNKQIYRHVGKSRVRPVPFSSGVGAACAHSHHPQRLLTGGMCAAVPLLGQLCTPSENARPAPAAETREQRQELGMDVLGRRQEPPNTQRRWDARSPAKGQPWRGSRAACWRSTAQPASRQSDMDMASLRAVGLGATWRIPWLRLH